MGVLMVNIGWETANRHPGIVCVVSAESTSVCDAGRLARHDDAG